MTKSNQQTHSASTYVLPCETFKTWLFSPCCAAPCTYSSREVKQRSKRKIERGCMLRIDQSGYCLSSPTDMAPVPRGRPRIDGSCRRKSWPLLRLSYLSRAEILRCKACPSNSSYNSSQLLFVFLILREVSGTGQARKSKVRRMDPVPRQLFHFL